MGSEQKFAAKKMVTPLVGVAELPHYSCLAHLGSDEHDRVWTFVGQRGASIRVYGSFDSNSALALRKAALAGLGIALLPEEYIASDLAPGALVRILPRYEIRRPATALCARSPHIPQKVRLLVSFLVQWFKHERAGNHA